MLLTGASRGIGHATVKRFSAAGWRVITCSRHPFPENCPWEMGPEDHLQVDLADAADTVRGVREVAERLAGRMAARDLSDREREVLGLLAEGRSNKQIAKALGIADGTVKVHVANVLEKLGAQGRSEAVAVAARRGLVRLG